MTRNDGQLATVDQLRAVGSKAIRRYKLLDPLPVSGLRLRVQSLIEREMSQYQTEMFRRGKEAKPERMRAANGRLFVRVLVNAEGNRLLADNDAGLFEGWDAADTLSLYDQVAIHLGIREAEVEDLEKNSERIAGDLQPLPSPSE